jgi:hypothetical protein
MDPSGKQQHTVQHTQSLTDSSALIPSCNQSPAGTPLTDPSEPSGAERMDAAARHDSESARAEAVRRYQARAADQGRRDGGGATAKMGAGATAEAPAGEEGDDEGFTAGKRVQVGCGVWGCMLAACLVVLRSWSHPHQNSCTLPPVLKPTEHNPNRRSTNLQNLNQTALDDAAAAVGYTAGHAADVAQHAVDAIQVGGWVGGWVGGCGCL